MTIAKWSAISVFGLGALAIAGAAMGGCSSTDSTDDGTLVPPDTDQDSSTPATCTANTNEDTGLFDSACQDALNAACCNELANCFNIVPADSTKQDCNAYIRCRDKCTFMADGTTPETDQDLITQCQDTDCVAVTDEGVVTAFDGLGQCINGDPASDAACPK